MVMFDGLLMVLDATFMPLDQSLDIWMLAISCVIFFLEHLVILHDGDVTLFDVTRRGCSTLSFCVGCVMGGILDDWMDLALYYVCFSLMLMWWGDACFIGVVFLRDITL
jgi:hypothetical protein